MPLVPTGVGVEREKLDPWHLTLKLTEHGYSSADFRAGRYRGLPALEKIEGLEAPVREAAWDLIAAGEKAVPRIVGFLAWYSGRDASYGAQYALRALADPPLGALWDVESGRKWERDRMLLEREDAKTLHSRWQHWLERKQTPELWGKPVRGVSLKARYAELDEGGGLRVRYAMSHVGEGPLSIDLRAQAFQAKVRVVEPGAGEGGRSISTPNVFPEDSPPGVAQLEPGDEVWGALLIPKAKLGGDLPPRTAISIEIELPQAARGPGESWHGKVRSNVVTVTERARYADTGRLPVPQQARIEFVPEKAEYLLGEPTYVRFALKNIGQEEFRYATGSDYRGASRPLRYKFRAWDEAGGEVADADPHEFCMGGIGGPRPLNPGETYGRMLLLQSWCRFESPGTYRVGAAVDLGWGEGDPEYSSTGYMRTKMAEFRITLREPTAEEANAVLDGMVSDIGKKDSWKWQDQRRAAFHVIRSGAYLPHLVRLTSDTDEKIRKHALQGIGSILTPEGTRALIGLLEHPEAAFGLEAAKTLSWRLTDPELKGKLGPRSPFRFHSEGEHARAVKLCWRDEMSGPVLEWAKERLGSGDADAIRTAAFMMQCLGGPEGLKLIAAALDEVAEGWRRWPEKGEYEATGAANELVRAAAVILKNGARPVEEPATAGEAVIWAAAIGSLETFRPAGWQARAAGLLGHRVAFLRSSVLSSLPKELPEEVKALLPDLVRDPDRSVRYAACEVVKRTKEKSCLKDVLELLRTETEEWNIREAVNAAWAAGGKGEYVDVLVERLDDTRVSLQMMDHLASWVLRSRSYHGSGRSGTPSEAEARRMKARWKSWLPEHREAVLKENGFPLGDPRLDPGLFFSGSHWNTKDGRRWPPGRE